MVTPNPLQNPHPNPPPSISLQTFPIAGILTDVYGLDELSPSCKSISCLWLLHPRLQTRQIMASIAASCINDWNRSSSAGQNIGLVAVTFDQRNHGSRQVDPLANQAWREGNVRHAQDMFRYLLHYFQKTRLIIRSIIHGTALDTSLLIDHIGSYIFARPNAPSIDQHVVLGISLGGHAAWQVIMNEPRVTAAVVIIGCPDYMSECYAISKSCLSHSVPIHADIKGC
jgi:hypothetical protein